MVSPLADRVREQTTFAGGTGAVTLPVVAVSGDQTFLSGWGASGTGWYCLVVGSQWETGFGTLNAGGTTLTRTAPLDGSSGAATLVNFSAGTIDCTGVAPAAIVGMLAGAPSSGYLSFVSTTQIKFMSKNGDRFKINRKIYGIPSAGITVANMSVFVNGTGAQNLAASTAYLVTLFDNAGTLTVDFISTLTHAPSTTAGNIGTEIKNGDETRTIIGMVYTNASSQFTDMGTVSWFNRQTKSAQTTFSTGRTTTSASTVEVNSEIRNSFATWANENVIAVVGGNAYPSATANHRVETGIGFDGTTRENPYSIIQAETTNQSYGNVLAIVMKSGLSEGGHYATLVGNVGGAAQTANWDSTVNVTVRIRG